MQVLEAKTPRAGLELFLKNACDITYPYAWTVNFEMLLKAPKLNIVAICLKQYLNPLCLERKFDYSCDMAMYSPDKSTKVSLKSIIKHRIVNIPLDVCTTTNIEGHVMAVY